ncbi:MAG TPA: DegT/DnrJ/EryC1/StrS family aminotransferase, partial [Candidatus Saccharimonadales bacterium]|nr:DegT/DnrJ/EryC1/StrS family aminotransferase [Candidatus Saccharimonadales bacterium]
IRKMSNFGFGKNRTVEEIGFNGKLQEINAAIGLWQLEYIDYKIDKRHQILKLYKKELSKRGFAFQENDNKSAVVFVSALAPSSDIAQELHAALEEEGIESNRYYNPPLHKHPAFSNVGVAYGLSTTEDICNRIISLPNHSMVNERTVSKIISKINL